LITVLEGVLGFEGVLGLEDEFIGG